MKITIVVRKHDSFFLTILKKWQAKGKGKLLCQQTTEAERAMNIAQYKAVTFI